MINTTISNTPYLLIGDMFEYMKTKTQNKVRYTSYMNILWNTLLEMFEYKNLPTTIPKRFLESILHSTGEVFVSEINGELIASHGTLSGEVDAYGLGTECIAVCPTGESRGIRGTDIAYGVNNDTGTPDTLVYWIAHLLGETDKSINLNVLYSRMLKIPKVSNEKDKAMLEELVKKLMDGTPQAFASTSPLELELGNGAEEYELTDVNKIDKLPYLTQFFEDCIKRFYNFYGQPMQNQNKRAQSISDEIHGQDSVSFIIPLQMLRCRQALCDEINRIFGTDISVEFSPVWAVELSGLINRDTNGNKTADIIETETETGETEMETGETETETGETETETGETETETGETETELIKDIINEETPTDLPAMDLNDDNPIEAKSDEIEGIAKKIADALGVSVDEILELIK